MDSLVLLLTIAIVMGFISSGLLQFAIIIATWQGLVIFKKGKPSRYFQHILEFNRKSKFYPAKETRGGHFK